MDNTHQITDMDKLTAAINEADMAIASARARVVAVFTDEVRAMFAGAGVTRLRLAQCERVTLRNGANSRIVTGVGLFPGTGAVGLAYSHHNPGPDDATDYVHPGIFGHEDLAAVLARVRATLAA